MSANILMQKTGAECIAELPQRNRERYSAVTECSRDELPAAGGDVPYRSVKASENKT